jgi:hypothetical protein
MKSVSSLVSAARRATIVSGGRPPLYGISYSRSTTRSLVDNSSVGSDGKGMPLMQTSSKDGAEPPKKEAVRMGTCESLDESQR